MASVLRHRYDPAWPTVPFMPAPCRCGMPRTNIIHRLGGRCSMCFRYFRHYELDSSRRCNECRP